jgi:hypothetical protein
MLSVQNEENVICINGNLLRESLPDKSLVRKSIEGSFMTRPDNKGPHRSMMASSKLESISPYANLFSMWRYSLNLWKRYGAMRKFSVRRVQQ